MTDMTEQLLHYAWKHRLFPSEPMQTTDGTPVEILNPGLWNHNAGPDFFNAKVRIGEEVWVGNIEIHLHSSDWYRHGHQTDAAYDNVILHVVGVADGPVATASGRSLPQLEFKAPPNIEANFQQLMTEETFPPCYRVIPTIAHVKVHAWISALTVERLEQKTERISHWLCQTQGDWERAYFITLARTLGFGVNSDTFEQWASTIDLRQVGKHRDSLLQVEAFFLGTAGLIDRIQSPEHEREWLFLQNKFSLTALHSSQWKYMRMRPQNFPHVRLLQLAQLFSEGSTSLSHLLAACSADAIRHLYHNALPHLQDTTLDLILINTAAPILFAHAREHGDESRTETAFELLEQIRAEHNYITRSWQKAGLEVKSAADSQALIQLRKNYCDRKDCLRCRFGAEYLSCTSFTTGQPLTPHLS